MRVSLCGPFHWFDYVYVEFSVLPLHQTHALCEGQGGHKISQLGTQKGGVCGLYLLVTSSNRDFSSLLVSCRVLTCTLHLVEKEKDNIINLFNKYTCDGGSHVAPMSFPNVAFFHFCFHFPFDRCFHKRKCPFPPLLHKTTKQ